MFVTGGFPKQTESDADGFCYVSRNKLLNKQSVYRRFEIPRRYEVPKITAVYYSSMFLFLLFNKW